MIHRHPLLTHAPFGVCALLVATGSAFGQLTLNLTHTATVGGTAGPPDAADVVVFDLNNDGFEDVVTYNSEGIFAPPTSPDFLAYMLGNGDGTFGPVVDSIASGLTQVATGEVRSRMRLGEFTGDAFLDLVLTHHHTHEIALIPNDGAGGFGAPVHIDTGSPVSSLFVADFDGDGRDDVVAVSSNGFDVHFLAGTGSGLAAPVTQASGLLSNYTPMDFEVADVDGDGALDVLVPYLLDETQALTNQIVGFSGNGDGTFDVATPFFVATGTPLAGAHMTIQVDDLDRDGFEDIVAVRDVFTGGVAEHFFVTYGNAGGFDAPVAYPVSGQENLTECAIVDLDLDGHLDVVTICNGPFVYEVMQGDGARGLAPLGQVDVLGAAGMFALATEDVDADSKPDLILGFQYTGTLQVWHNETPSIGTNYCMAGPNSVSADGSRISASGSASIAAANLRLIADNAPAQPAVFYYGPNQSNLAFGNGVRCVGGTVVRLPIVVGSGGTFEYQIDFVADGLTAGAHNFQCWYRDPAGGGTFFNLSDAIELTLIP